MKLGVSYNVFDGEELLVSSIRSIRDEVDYINVVYQLISNRGNPATEGLEDFLHALLKDRLIDELYYYEPDLYADPGVNQTGKRNIGLQLAKKHNCTHFMSFDADEFYESRSFHKAKQFIQRHRVGCSAVRIVSYIKEPIYQIKGYRDVDVPFICEIDAQSEIRPNNSFPVLVNPTRCVNGCRTFHLFSEDKIVMHHMELVRRDLEKKFANSSSPSIRILRKHTLAWEYGKQFQYTDQGPKLKVLRVDNKFGIRTGPSDLTVPLAGEKKNTVLLTSHHLVDFAGSEITTLEKALVLRRLGYEVSVATFHYDFPIKEIFQKNEIRVFDVLLGQLPLSEYDIVWCQHGPVISRLLGLGIKFKKAVFHSLSFLVEMEALPYFATDFDLILAISGATADRYCSDGWVKQKEIEIFPNSVLPEFFEKAKTKLKDRIERIAIVSNHVVPELMEAVELFRTRQIPVDIIGRGKGEHKLVTPETLLNYDVVITIGKTVQYCLALRIPVYCYDRFGGPGYILTDNMNRVGYCNFSGRCCHRKLEAAQIVEEIVAGYSEALKSAVSMQTAARAEYDLVTNVKKVLDKLANRPVNRAFYCGEMSREMKIQVVHSQYYHQAFKKQCIYLNKLTKTEAALTKSKEKASEAIAILKYREELYNVYTSRSWRYTAPLRGVGSLMRRALAFPHQPRIRGVIKWIYFLLPAVIRNSRWVEHCKERFKSKETVVYN